MYYRIYLSAGANSRIRRARSWGIAKRLPPVLFAAANRRRILQAPVNARYRSGEHPALVPGYRRRPLRYQLFTNSIAGLRHGVSMRSLGPPAPSVSTFHQ